MVSPVNGRPPITVVGGGIAGAACAVALRDAGRPVRVLDRGRGPGGRMASPELDGRRVDVGAGYFTVRDAEFAALVERWRTAGLAREWTDTFGVLAAGAKITTKTGPMRWAAPGGLRSLVRALLDGIEVVSDVTVEELPDDDVVLAMPDPQAARLVQVHDEVTYAPVITVVCGFAERTWPFDAAFVHDHPDVEFVADDGSRRGDAAPVLVAHTTASRAAKHLDDPHEAIEPVVAALSDLLLLDPPNWTHVHRWTFAKPRGQHAATYRIDRVDGRLVGLAGDQWCPEGTPRVESAWRSGIDLGRALAATGT